MIIMAQSIHIGLFFFSIFGPTATLPGPIRGRTMVQCATILNAKLLIPRSSNTINRDRLLTLLAETTNKRLTTVIAGAGYGKTTLIAQAVSARSVDTVWYRLDAPDKDLVVFLRYLIAGFQKYFPEFGLGILARIESSEKLSNQQDTVLTMFVGELEKAIKKEIMIVLDDFHLVNDSPEIKNTIEFFLSHFPPLVHLVLISREQPSIPLSRLAARRQMIHITEEELALTPSELERLYLQLFRLPLNPGTIEILHEKTCGWVSGLILYYHKLKGKNPRDIDKIVSRFSHSNKMVFSYLEENVFQMLESETKEFLIKTAVLSRLDAEFCNSLLQITNSRDILKRLEDSHLFTFCVDEERQWYYYHHLFQGFLRSKLTSEMDAIEIRALHGDAAVLYETEGDDEEAVNHFILAERIEEACQVLARIARSLIKKGRLQRISSYLKNIPCRYHKREPWIQFLQAGMMEISGNPQHAIPEYESALINFRRRNLADAANECLVELAFNHLYLGNFKSAETAFTQLLKKLDVPHLRMEAFGHLSFISCLLGDMKASKQYFDAAFSELPDPNDDMSGMFTAMLKLYKGWRLYFSGDFLSAASEGKEVKALFWAGSSFRVQALNYHLVALTHLHMGRFAEGLESARAGLSMLKRKGVRPDMYYALLLISSAFNSLFLSGPDQALSEAEESLKCFQNFGSRWGQSWSLWLMHLIDMLMGKPAAAESKLRAGLDLIHGMGIGLNEGQLKISLSMVLVQKRQFEEAQQLLREIDNRVARLEWYRFWIALVYARLYTETGDHQSALDQFTISLQLSEAKAYDFWIVFGKDWMIPLLVGLYSHGKMKPYIQRIFKALGPEAESGLSRLHNPGNPRLARAAAEIMQCLPKPPPQALKIHLFGRFRILRGSKEIPADRWKSKKALMIFKYLICRRMQGYTPRDMIMELIWPDENPEKTRKRFHVALAALRKTLEPELPRGVQSSYILSSGDAYLLNVGEDGWVDTEHFNRELELAKNCADSSITHHLNAEALYAGPFLAEDLYVPWCEHERERLQNDYLHILEEIIGFYESQKQLGACIDYTGKYLNTDKYAEHIYQKLIKYYASLGNNTMAARTYKKCRQHIAVELDIPLSSETEKIYKEILAVDSNTIG